MKRRSYLFIILLVSLVLFSTSNAETGNLPSIDSLLRSNLPDKRIEVSVNLDEYSYTNPEWTEWADGDIKLIILERQSPEKEFTEKKTYPPINDDDGFPDDFEGIDIGTSRVWLRGDLMQKIPDALRANSISEATHLIIAEDAYVLSSVIMVFDYLKKDDDIIPEFETTQEMIEYFSKHQPVLSSVTYHPVFGSYSFISCYETKTKHIALFEAKYSPGKIFARNPEASIHWNNMVEISDLANVLSNDSEKDKSSLKAQIDSYDFVPQKTKDTWISCIDAGDYYMASLFAEGYFWKMASKFKELDSSTRNQKNYDVIIQDKDVYALTQYVQYCDYSGFNQSMDSIRESKDYLTMPDRVWIEQTLQEVIKEMFG